MGQSDHTKKTSPRGNVSCNPAGLPHTEDRPHVHSILSELLHPSLLQSSPWELSWSTCPCWRGRGGRNPYRQAHDDAGSGVEDARLACARGRVPLRLAFGMVDDLDMQREVAEAAVRLLEQAREPETRPRPRARVAGRHKDRLPCLAALIGIVSGGHSRAVQQDDVTCMPLIVENYRLLSQIKVHPFVQRRKQ